MLPVLDSAPPLSACFRPGREKKFVAPGIFILDRPAARQIGCPVVVDSAKSQATASKLPEQAGGPPRPANVSKLSFLRTFGKEPRHMLQFAEAFPDEGIVSTLSRQ